MSEVDKLNDALERQSELIAGLRNEIATKDKQIALLADKLQAGAYHDKDTALLLEQQQRIAELESENEFLQESLDSKGMGMWEVVAMKDRALAEYEQVVAELKAQANDDDTAPICAGCGFAIEPDILWGADQHAYHAKCLPADGRTYSEGCAL